MVSIVDELDSTTWSDNVLNEGKYNLLPDGTRLWYVTVATKPHDNLTSLLSLAQKFNVNIVVLGMGNTSRLYQWGSDFSVKLAYVGQLVDVLPPEDMFLFTDAFDVMLVKPLEEIYQKYLTYQTDIVVSGESVCSPDPTRAKDYPTLGGTYPFVNSGTFIGRAGSIANLMSYNPYPPREDDQRYWTTLYLENRLRRGEYNPNLITIDSESNIFMCMAKSLNDVVLQDDHTYLNIKTGNSPCIIHFNGSIDYYGQYYQRYTTSNKSSNSLILWYETLYEILWLYRISPVMIFIFILLIWLILLKYYY